MLNKIPLYMQIKEDLNLKITSGQWKPNEKIPTELELCEIYNVSRITIRKAIEMLVNEGLLIRKRAIGTFVTEKEINHSMMNFHSREKQNFGRMTYTLEATVKKIKASPKIASLLNCEQGEVVMNLKRVFGTKNHAFAYFNTYFTRFESVSEDPDDYYDSFYSYLNDHGINPIVHKEYIEAVLPTQLISEKLNIKQDKPLLKRVRQVTQLGNNFNEYSECFYIGEEYRFYVDTSLYKEDM